MSLSSTYLMKNVPANYRTEDKANHLAWPSLPDSISVLWVCTLPPQFTYSNCVTYTYLQIVFNLNFPCHSRNRQWISPASPNTKQITLPIQSRPSVIKSVRPSHCGHSLLVVGGRSVSSVCNQILKHSPCPLLIGLTGLIGQVYMCRMSIDSAVLAMPCGVGGGGRSGGVSTSEQGTLNTHPSRGHQLC